MIRNNNQTSYHYAVDDIEIVQGLPEDRNGWHAGDGNGKGNRSTIAIEICYSTGDKAKFEKAQENAAEFVAYKLKQYNWGIEKVYTHKHWSGKHCPHRTLDEYGWEYFLDLVEKYMGKQAAPTGEMYRIRKSWDDVKSQIGAFTNLENAKKACKDGYYVFDSKGNVIFPEKEITVAPPAPTKKSNLEIAKEVIAGKWGNGQERKNKLAAAGYDYNAVQAEVKKLLGQTEPAKPVLKSNAEIAQEVMAGKWGNGDARKKALEAAGYNYAAVQAEVQKLVKPEPPKPVLKSNAEIAKEIMAGKWGNGDARRQALEAAGYNYAAVQAEVQKLVKPEPPKPVLKSNAEIAKEVMVGKWGNGDARKKALEAAGYNYAAVQAEVQKLVGGNNAPKGYKVMINTGALNVRKGAGANYGVVKVVRQGQVYTIVEEKSGWGKLSDGSGWISLNYTKRV